MNHNGTFITKLGLTIAEIRARCIGAAFDGQYFRLDWHEAIAKRMIEAATGGPASATEVQNLMQWMLCTWDLTHRMELVTEDNRADKLGVDVDLMAVSWYAQTPKDISAMYACCSYGKQYEELLQTAEHLGRRWYVMAKFCATRFAKSELKVYINLEYNYITYRGTWGRLEAEEEIPDLPQQREPRHQQQQGQEVDDWEEPLADMLRREMQQHQQREEQQ
jgi:hypothetical protein